MQKQRYRLRVFDCITGKEIADWLIKHQRASVPSEAKLWCQCFINETYLEPVVFPGTPFVEFKADQTLYKFGKVKTTFNRLWLRTTMGFFSLVERLRERFGFV